MTFLTLEQAGQYLADVRLLGDTQAAFERISTDSRTAGPGDLFVALKGERFDAHDFLPEVAARGVSAVLAARVPQGWSVPTLQVPDTLRALGELARGWRGRFKIPLVAVTGSNGKTTVKEMIAAIFAAAAGEAGRLATRGNLNNEIGVPLTLLRLRSEHRLAVVELGMNHPGETGVLAALAQPTIALVNNAQREHQEFMATVEAVALEHATVIHALPDDGVAIYPADDTYSAIWRTAAAGRPALEFSLAEPEQALAAARPHVMQAHAVQTQISGSLHDTRVLSVRTPQGECEIVLNVLGQHNARNALAAVAAALAAGVALEAVKRGLESFESVKGRLQVKSATVAPLAGATVIDDTYNANPDSMRAAIAVLAAQPAPRVLVIGDMGEVGDHGPEFHREIGKFAHDGGIEILLALGPASTATCQAFGVGGHHFESVEALLEHLLAHLPGTAGLDARSTLLVKGSRFMRMERVVEALTAPTTPQAPGAQPAAH
jgi:UDP-N-acetylmuramoyl-tripeptide--D-alanyl-D-alanine ligase